MFTVPSQPGRYKHGGGGLPSSVSEGVPMQQLTQTVRSFPLCVQCAETLVAPAWTEYFGDDCRIIHVWSCDTCDYKFVTTVDCRAPNIAAAAAYWRLVHTPTTLQAAGH